MPTSVLIIGAGWAGLAAAKTYLQISPSADLTILDDDTSLGGVWSTSRIYPGLIANSPNGLYEFSDLSMPAVSGKKPLTPIPGRQVHDYLHAYAEKYDLLRRIRFGTHVVKARRRQETEGWVLECRTPSGDECIECDKLMVCTGLSSKPNVPALPGLDDAFSGITMHSKSLGSRHDELAAPSVRNIVVVGGCKSAVETIGICLSAGKRVHWVVRPSQQGVPLIVVDPDQKPNLVAVSTTRLFGVWSPSIFATKGFWYRFLHSGAWWLGSLLDVGYWALLSWVVSLKAGYEKSTNGGLIQPKERNMFRYGSYISLVHTNNRMFLEGVHDESKVKVYRATPVRMEGDGMCLDSGEVIKADAVVFATGWKPTVDFFESEEAKDLGIPIDVGDQDLQTAKYWAQLGAEEDGIVTKTFPRLARCELTPANETKTTQFRMYRQVLSPRLFARGDRSITFVGLIASGQTSFCDELQSLWAIAWMEGLLPCQLPSEREMEGEVAKVNAWMARRYGARGARDPEIILEIQTFFDVLMQDLGLKVSRRNKGRSGGLREWLTPYEAADYRGIVEEFLAKVRVEGKRIAK